MLIFNFKVGSTINLTCVVSNTARPPLKVQWRRDYKIIIIIVMIIP